GPRLLLVGVGAAYPGVPVTGDVRQPVPDHVGVAAPVPVTRAEPGHHPRGGVRVSVRIVAGAGDLTDDEVDPAYLRPVAVGVGAAQRAEPDLQVDLAVAAAEGEGLPHPRGAAA